MKRRNAIALAWALGGMLLIGTANHVAHADTVQTRDPVVVVLKDILRELKDIKREMRKHR